jgi:hypothetical protein
LRRILAPLRSHIDRWPIWNDVREKDSDKLCMPGICEPGLCQLYEVAALVVRVPFRVFPFKCSTQRAQVNDQNDRRDQPGGNNVDVKVEHKGAFWKMDARGP